MMSSSTQGHPAGKIVEATHASAKSHQFTNTNPISVDPYAQSPQVNFNYPQNVPILKQPKTAKQQRSLSDQFGGSRRQAQHNMGLKQAEQSQAQTKKVNKQQVPSHPQLGGQMVHINNFGSNNQMNHMSQINQIPINAAKRASGNQAASGGSGHPHAPHGAGHQNSNSSGGTAGNPGGMTGPNQNSSKTQKAGAGGQKMITLNSKLQGIYKQYKTVSGASNPGHQAQIPDNTLSPKDFAFLSQTQNNPTMTQSSGQHPTQKQRSQSGSNQYHTTGSQQAHEGRNVQNRFVSYQPGSFNSGQQKALDGLQIQKNTGTHMRDQHKDKSPGHVGQSQSSAAIQLNQIQTGQKQAKMGGHPLKSQSMHAIPQAQPQQHSKSNKFHHFGPSASQTNFQGALDQPHEGQNKKHHQSKVVQAHSVTHLGQGDAHHTQPMRLPSGTGKRPESHGALEGAREQNRAGLTQSHGQHQRQGTPSNKHRRMSPKIMGLEHQAQAELHPQNARLSQGNNQGQGVRLGPQDLHSNAQGSHPNYNSQPFSGYSGQRQSSQEQKRESSKAQASAAPASGVNSTVAHAGAAPTMDRQAPTNSYMDAKTIVGVVTSKTDGSGGLSQSIKQIPIRQVKVRNKAGSNVDVSRSFNLSIKDSQVQGKYDKLSTGENQTNFHHRGQSHQNGAELRPDGKQMVELQGKQGYHQRKEARIPSAGKKRVPSSQGVHMAKRVPSAQRLKQQIQDQQKQQHSTKPNHDDKKKDAEPKDELSGSFGGPTTALRTRSSITNVRRSRNEAKASLPDNQGSDLLNSVDNPTSAGQSTSSLYKQEQINKKFKFQETQPNEKQKLAPAAQEEDKRDDHKVGGAIDSGDQGKAAAEQRPPSSTPKDTKSGKGAGQGDQGPGISTEAPKEQDVGKPADAQAGTTAAAKDKKGTLGGPTTGLSGRNLYFNQIRNEITLSESGKCKGLPDYQNAKYSNKRNGLVSGYGANTNQGIVRNYNEDRVAIILNIMKPKSKNYESQQWPKCSFFGIYDGHGGAVCADFLRDYLHQFIIKDENFPQNPIQALRNGYREAERLFMEFAESQEKEAGEIDRSGSCAVVILIIDDMCYCANTGDSRAIMSADGGEKLFLLSTDHKPTDEIEMKRIIEGGGRIYQNSQVIQTNPSLGEVGKQMVYGPHRVFPGRLSVSRTIGDIEAKIEKYEGNANVVIADPDVTAFEIKDNHDFIVIGCDGVFDKLSSKDAIHIAWQKVLMEAGKSNVDKVELNHTHQNCGHCVDGILRTAALRRTVDNVTCVVVAFDGFQRQLQKFISNNQDGTTVDVIEEIQLEPIPEYLSNTKMNPANKRSAGPSDNSMLLLDDNQALAEPENPLIAGKNLRGPPRPGEIAVGKKTAAAAADNKLLSEIAEEDDISSVSDNTANKHGSTAKPLEGAAGFAAKGSIHSITDTSIHDGDPDPSSLTERQTLTQKAQMEQKRRSQLIPANSAVPVSSNAAASDVMNKAKQSITSLESRLLEDLDVDVVIPKKQQQAYGS